MFLSKQVRTIVAGRQKDAQTIELLGSEPITLPRWFGTTKNTPWGKEGMRMASALLGKYASISVVDLIQWKKLDFRNFYD